MVLGRGRKESIKVRRKRKGEKEKVRNCSREILKVRGPAVWSLLFTPESFFFFLTVPSFLLFLPPSLYLSPEEIYGTSSAVSVSLSDGGGEEEGEERGERDELTGRGWG